MVSSVYDADGLSFGGKRKKNDIFSDSNKTLEYGCVQPPPEDRFWITVKFEDWVLTTVFAWLLGKLNFAFKLTAMHGETTRSDLRPMSSTSVARKVHAAQLKEFGGRGCGLFFFCASTRSRFDLRKTMNCTKRDAMRPWYFRMILSNTRHLTCIATVPQCHKPSSIRKDSQSYHQSICGLLASNPAYKGARWWCGNDRRIRLRFASEAPKPVTFSLLSSSSFF